LEQMAYVLSHDIKTPLRGISTVAHWIAADFGPVVDDDARENIDLMLDRIDRLDRLISGILDYSRAGRGEVEKNRVHIADVLVEVLVAVAPPPHIEVQLQSDFPVVEYNETQLRQVFQNLIDNGIKHLGKSQGTVTVSWTDGQNAWEFRVEDNGVGIPKRHFERIFSLFQTLRPKDETKTAGIGLAIAKQIVESNGGQIRVESIEHEGTAFTFTVLKPS